jgi:predicted ribosome quality control (RQC) complex YloA/Tae2 family protein
VLSIRETARAVAILAERLVGGHLERIVQRDATRLELVFSTPPRGEAKRERILLVVSCHPEAGRVGEAERFEPAPAEPPAFAMRLRARIGRARVEAIFGREGEREIGFRFATREAACALVLRLFGPRSNVHLQDERGEILASMRPLATTPGELRKGDAVASPVPTPRAAGEDRFADVCDDEFLREVERRERACERDKAAEALARSLATVFSSESKRLARREAAIRSDLAKGRPATELAREGELLKGALHEIPRAAERVSVRDPVDGRTLEILLDPERSASANLERVFALYRRAKRRESAAARQLVDLEAERADLEALRASFDAIASGCESPDLEALERLALQPRLAGVLGRRRRARTRSAEAGGTPRARPRKGETPRPLRPTRYRTRDGLEVWVGRNAAGNDHLTTRLARGNDLFFHVEASPGSHVVLRTAGRRDPPQESLLDAAELAVHFSKQRHGTRATVHVARILDVRKPRGAKPGLVRVRRGRTLPLRRDEGRLARILASRIEDDA